MKATTPSTHWKEQVAADEGERFERYNQIFTEVQARKSARYGTGRALHRKQIIGLAATFEVLPGLPAHAAHGLFAKAQTLDAWVRISNGGMDKLADAKPDVRGFAFKVLGVHGPGALGQPTEAQDFLLINQPAFAFAGVDEFVGLVQAASHGNGALLKYFIQRYGVLGGLKLLAKFGKTMAKPFKGFANESFFTAAPLACGPYACRMRVLPPEGEAVNAAAKADFGADVLGRVKARALVYTVQLQPFVDEARTPIEDASIDWPEAVSPYVTVAKLTIARQDPSSAKGQALQQQIEHAAFDPWCALAEHRPLGEVMRGRKAVYFTSQKNRGLHA